MGLCLFLLSFLPSLSLFSPFALLHYSAFMSVMDLIEKKTIVELKIKEKSRAFFTSLHPDSSTRICLVTFN